MHNQGLEGRLTQRALCCFLLKSIVLFVLRVISVPHKGAVVFINCILSGDTLIRRCKTYNICSQLLTPFALWRLLIRTISWRDRCRHLERIPVW
jgi:hypothetical protein